MAELHERLPPGQTVGMNTFRSFMPGGSTMLRQSLYNKNYGSVTHDTGLIRTDSPISGTLLLSRATTSQAVRDPTTGTTLKFQGARACVTTPVQKQHLLHSKKFYLTKDVDITLQMLRSTTKVNQYTNEKVGTAGTPTGMDNSLKAVREAQRQQTLRQQQQAAAEADMA